MVTIKDVAKLAGVSASTASRALHDSSMISQKTKDRVHRAMIELDYSPNYAARNLVNQKTNTIGIVLPVRERQESLGDNPFFMQIIQGISSVCSENDYMVSIATGRSVQELQKNVQTLIRSGNITKFIFLYSKRKDPVFEFVRQQSHISCVTIGQSYEKKCYPNSKYVNNDNRQAGKDATNFLVEKGYENLVFVYTDMDELVQLERYEGYKESVSMYDREALSLQLSRTDDQDNSHRLSQFLDKHSEVQGFVSCDDIMAVHLQKCFKIIGILANKYAIIGFNNSLMTEIASPSLSSISVFPYQLGEKAAQALLTPCSESEGITIIPHQIIERESTPDTHV